MQVSLSEASAQLGALLEQAEAGEEIVLTRNGEPAARLVAIMGFVHATDTAAGRKRPAAEALDAFFRQTGMLPATSAA